MILVNLFCCCEKVLIHIHTWRRKIFLQPIMEGITDADYMDAKRVHKDFKMNNSFIECARPVHFPLL